MSKTRLLLTILFIVTLVLLLNISWFLLTENPRGLFVVLPNMLRVIKAFEEERDRKAPGFGTETLEDSNEKDIQERFVAASLSSNRKCRFQGIRKVA